MNQHNNQYPLCMTCIGLPQYIQKIHQRNADSQENMAWHTVVHLVPQCSSNGIPYYTETITTLSKAMYKTSAHYVRYHRMQRRYCLTDVNTKNPPSNTPPIFKHKSHKPFFLLRLYLQISYQLHPHRSLYLPTKQLKTVSQIHLSGFTKLC